MLCMLLTLALIALALTALALFARLRFWPVDAVSSYSATDCVAESRALTRASLGVVVTALSPPPLFGAMTVYAVLWFPVMCPCL